MRTRASRAVAAAVLVVCLLVMAGTAHSGRTSTSDYEAVLADLESSLRTCDADSHSRGHGSHKKCCLRTWPADPAAAEALGLMIVHPTPAEADSPPSFSQSHGLYRLGQHGQWVPLFVPERQGITHIQPDAPALTIRYDGPAHRVTITHEEAAGTAAARTMRSYVGDCTGHGPWWWDGQPMAEILSRVEADSTLPMTCPQIEGPYGEHTDAHGLQTGYWRGEDEHVRCTEPGAAVARQAPEVAVKGALSALTPAKMVLPEAWGCAAAGVPYGPHLISRSEHAYTVSLGAPVGTIALEDGVVVTWPEWEAVRSDGSPRRSPFQAQGAITLTDPRGRTVVDVRIGPAEDGDLHLQGHGRYRRYSTDGALTASGHFFDGARDGAWMQVASNGDRQSEVFGSTAHPDGQWAYLYSVQPIGCPAALEQMQRAVTPVSSAAYTDRISARVATARARLQQEEARMGRDGMDAEEQQFVGCVRDILSQLSTFSAEVSRARDSGQPPTGACRSWLDSTMGMLSAPSALCAGWARSALGADLFRSAQTYRTAQTQYQELSCRCERIGDPEAAAAWLQEVGARAAEQWPTAP